MHTYFEGEIVDFFKNITLMLKNLESLNFSYLELTYKQSAGHTLHHQAASLANYH